MKPARRKLLFLGLLSIGSSLLIFIAIEIMLRLVIFGHVDFFANELRRPKLYANWLHENYWKLHVTMDGRFKPPKTPHPLLGWVGSFDRETLFHHQAAEVGEKRPVLLYGDSFAACVTKLKFQDLLNSDPDFSKNHFLLNYGVGGYGVDQIYLLLKNTVPLYNNPIVILSFMTLNLDRSIMSFRTGQKPCFRLNNGVVRQMKTKIDSNPYRYLELNPPQIRSYFLSLLSTTSGVLEQKPDLEEIKAVNRYLIRESVSFLRSHDASFIVVVFHPNTKDSPLTIADPEVSWRSDFIYTTLSDFHAPHISTRDLIRSDADTKGQRLFSDYFIENDGHPTDLYNRLVADEIKKFVLSQ